MVAEQTNGKPPFTPILNEVIYLIRDMKDGQFVTYALLCSHVNTKRGDGKAWPYMTTLAREQGCSAATIKRNLKVLVQLGLIAMEERYRGYTFTVHGRVKGATSATVIPSMGAQYPVEKVPSMDARYAESIPSMGARFPMPIPSMGARCNELDEYELDEIRELDELAIASEHVFSQDDLPEEMDPAGLNGNVSGNGSGNGAGVTGAAGPVDQHERRKPRVSTERDSEEDAQDRMIAIVDPTMTMDDVLDAAEVDDLVAERADPYWQGSDREREFGSVFERYSRPGYQPSAMAAWREHVGTQRPALTEDGAFWTVLDAWEERWNAGDLLVRGWDHVERIPTLVEYLDTGRWHTLPDDWLAEHEVNRPPEPVMVSMNANEEPVKADEPPF